LLHHGSTVWKNVFDIDSDQGHKKNRSPFLIRFSLHKKERGWKCAAQVKKWDLTHASEVGHNLHPTYSLFFVLSLFFPFPCIRCFYRLLCLLAFACSAELFATACARTAEKQDFLFCWVGWLFLMHLSCAPFLNRISTLNTKKLFLSSLLPICSVKRTFSSFEMYCI